MLYEKLTASSTPQQVAAAYAEFAAANGGDTKNVQASAADFLRKTGISDATIQSAYSLYQQSNAAPEPAPATVVTEKPATSAPTPTVTKKSTNIYDYLNAGSKPELVAAAYDQFVRQSGGKDNADTQRAAEKYLKDVGISDATIKQSYQGYVTQLQASKVEPVQVDVGGQFAEVTQQMAQAGVPQEEINAFLQAEQAKADEFARQQALAEEQANAAFRDAEALATAQNQARIDADNAAFAQAQAEIAAQVRAEQDRLAQQRAAYEQQIAAQQEAAAAAQREAEAAQAAIAAQIAETQRLSAEMAKRMQDEREAMQRKSAAKIASSQKAGRTAADRSLLAGYGAAPGMPAVLGVHGSMGGGGSLGTGGTLGVG